ncbi:MAG: hypothetical protein R3B35_09065 [Gemmatimonadales bacterium]
MTSEGGADDGQHFTRLHVAGLDDKWPRLQEAFYQLLYDTLESASAGVAGDDTERTAAKYAADVGHVLSTMIRAKTEAPTLENERMRAEIQNIYEDVAAKREARLHAAIQRKRSAIALIKEAREEIEAQVRFAAEQGLRVTPHAEAGRLIVGITIDDGPRLPLEKPTDGPS